MPRHRSVVVLLAVVWILAAPLADAFAQRGPSYLRKRTYGGSFQDYGTTYMQTPDSGLMVFGYTCSDDKHAQNSGYHIHPFYRPQDAWILKLSKNWDIEWQKAYGGTGNDHIFSVIPGQNGGYIFCAISDSHDGDVVGSHGTSSDQDIWVVKITANGAIEWSKCYGGTSIDQSWQIIATFDGGYLISGSTYSTNGDVTGNHGNSDAWLIKITSTGSIQWQKTYGGSGADGGGTIIQTPDSGFVVCGIAGTADGDVLSNHGMRDVWLFKVDRNGTMQWQQSLGGPGMDIGWHMIPTKDGGYIFTGGASAMGGDVSYWRGGTGSDVWLVKLSNAGAIQWEKSYGGTNDDIGGYILEESDSSFLMSAYTLSLDGTVDFFHHGGSDAWLLKLDKAGKVIWQQTYGGSNYDYSAKVTPTANGYLFIGGTASKDGDILGMSLDSIQYNLGDIWLAELCQTTGFTLTADAPDLGSVPLCTFRDTTILIQDTGCYSMFIDSVKVTGADFALLKRPKNKILWDAIDTFVVRYQPAARGTSTGALTVYYNERYSQKTLTIPLTGTGGPGQVALRSSLDSFIYHFPATSTCSRKDTQYITIKNFGCDTIRILNVAFQDDGTTLVGSSVGKLPAKLIDKDSLWLRWIITPSTPGNFVAKIILTLGFPDGTTRDTVLTADAMIVPGVAKLSNSLNTSSYIFKSKPACTNIDSVRFTIRNLGCDTLEIVGATFTNDGVILVGSGPTTGSLIGNQELTYRWVVDPQQPGSYQSNIRITFKLPDGTTRDTMFSAGITILPGAPMFGSSLQSATYSFASRSLCAENDTAAIVLRNAGCDTLAIVKIEFNNASALSGSIGVWDSTLTASDSLVLQWVFDPDVQGLAGASMTITYRLLDGSEHDTTIQITALVLPGDALIVSSLGEPAFSFSTRPGCGDADSMYFSIRNPGCDSLSVVTILFGNIFGILEGSLTSTGPRSLISGDTIGFRWKLNATVPGTYTASISVTYKLPDGSQHDTTFSATVTITPGSKALIQSIASVDYGATVLCEERDTVLTFTNEGCDTLTVYAIDSAGTGYSVIAPTAFPIVVKPGESLDLRVRTVPADTTGHPFGFTMILNVRHTGDNGQLQIPFTRQIIYPVECAVVLSAGQTAGNLQRASYTASLAGTVPPGATSLSFDISYNSDLLELLNILEVPGISLTPGNRTTQGDLTTIHVTVSPVRIGDLVRLEFLAYLAKVDSTLLTIGNVRFNVASALTPDCIAIVTEGVSVFRYDDSCGEPTIRKRLQGKTAFEIVGMRPQPSDGEAVVYLDLRVYEQEAVTVTTRNVLGETTASSGSQVLAPGVYSIPIATSSLHEGVYFVSVEGISGTTVQKLIVR